jgi:M6 family metalloprotease-like protein
MSAIFGERLIFGQQNGPDIELRVFGDEFYARYETLQGYSVVYDLDRGQYCYAVLEDGQFVSSGAPVFKPIPYGLRRRLKETCGVHNDKFRQRYASLRLKEQPFGASSNVMHTFGRYSGLLDGRQLPIGQVKGLTILVEFPDLQSTITADDVSALLNGANFSEHGNFCSVREYYELMSSGRLSYTNRVVGPIRLSQKQSYYINNLLVPEALQIACNQYNLELGEFDSRNEGYIDALSVMYAGRSLYAGDLWPHNSVINLQIGGYRTHFYTIQSMGRNRIDLSIGTFTHETGHMLCRFPDLYDYGERDGDFEESSGLGQYCLMSWGNHLNGGKTPSAICAYLRDLAGWCDREVILNQPGRFEARHADYRTAWKFRTGKPHEYFLVENRHNEGLDQYLPDSGLAVYHCDTRGSNEFQDGTPDEHYQCALIQADGRLDLERSTRGGDSGDLFAASDGLALSDTTVPDANEWDRADSGMMISDISASAGTITFTSGEIKPKNIISESIIADLIIPDDQPDGIKSELLVDKTATLSSIGVTVDITHTYRGDLNVRLTAPSGKTVVLHSDAGGSLDNLHLDLNSESFAPLSELAGEAIEGRWTLHVADLLKSDVGRLDQWGLTIEYESAVREYPGEAKPAAPIPDFSADGIQSAISIAGSGSLKSLSVEVDITHTYRGDLQIELISPSGARALIRDNNGESQDDIREIYTEASTPALKALIGEEINGDWKLHVRDLAQYDNGILNRWALVLSG